LFSYAAVFSQARRLAVPCYVNKAFYEHVRPERNYHYEYELDVFDNGMIVPGQSNYHLPIFLGFPTVPVARWWHNQVPPILPGSSRSIFMEQSFTYDARLRDVQPGTTVLGIFQSWRYFNDCAAEIRERMSRLTRRSDWYVEMCENIQPGTGCIGLHVRRGDYTLPLQQKLLGLSTLAYYERSLSCLRRMGFDGPVYLATDSPDAVREEFAELARTSEFRTIDPPPDAHPLEVILLLSRLDGLVIANSSFSWWAGFIGERPGRVVIAPRPWFTKSDMDARDLLPPHWLTLDRNGYEHNEVRPVAQQDWTWQGAIKRNYPIVEDTTVGG
jgi:hypothetical protein